MGYQVYPGGSGDVVRDHLGGELFGYQAFTVSTEERNRRSSLREWELGGEADAGCLGARCSAS